MDPESVSIYIFFFLKHSCTFSNIKYMYMYFFLVFSQVSAAVKSLQEIYARDDVELSNLFKIVMDAMNVYNMKLKTMQKVRDVIRDNMGEEEYNRWSGQYVTEKPMHIQVGTASIVIFFSFLKLNTVLNITECFLTILNIFIFSGNSQRSTQTTSTV